MFVIDNIIIIATVVAVALSASSCIHFAIAKRSGNLECISDALDFMGLTIIYLLCYFGFVLWVWITYFSQR